MDSPKRVILPVPVGCEVLHEQSPMRVFDFRIACSLPHRPSPSFYYMIGWKNLCIIPVVAMLLESANNEIMDNQNARRQEKAITTCRRYCSWQHETTYFSKGCSPRALPHLSFTFGAAHKIILARFSVSSQVIQSPDNVPYKH